MMKTINEIQVWRLLSRDLMFEIINWEDKYRKKQKEKYPNITERELCLKVADAKGRRFRKKINILLAEHPVIKEHKYGGLA